MNLPIAEMVTEIQRDTETKGTAGYAMALTALNRAQLTLATRYDWQGLILAEDISVQAGESMYDLPEDWRKTIAPIYAEDLEIWPFWERDMSETESGTPAGYRIAANQVELYPVPDAGFVTAYPALTHRYYSIPADFVTPTGDDVTQESPWPTLARLVLTDLAKIFVAIPQTDSALASAVQAVCSGPNMKYLRADENFAPGMLPPIQLTTRPRRYGKEDYGRHR